MKFFIKYIFVLVLVVWLLVLLSCKHINHVDCDEEEDFVHTCPKSGHGVCPICLDPQYHYEYEKTMALDSKRDH